MRPLFYVRCSTLQEFMHYCADSKEILLVEDDDGLVLMKLYSLGAGKLHTAYLRVDEHYSGYMYICHNMTKDSYTPVNHFDIAGDKRYIPIVSAELIGMEVDFR